jgi:hypothetical protein
MTSVPGQSDVADPRGDASLLDKVGAVQLVIEASKSIGTTPIRAFAMTEWLLGTEPLQWEDRGAAAVRLFLAAAAATTEVGR